MRIEGHIQRANLPLAGIVGTPVSGWQSARLASMVRMVPDSSVIRNLPHGRNAGPHGDLGLSVRRGAVAR
jgi:hypothetical protein